MRQAGRYLPEYREIRESVDFITLCKTPELAAQVTLQPIDRLGVDAAILFSDILVPVEPMGLELDFTPGPVIDPPVRTNDDVERLRTPDPEEAVPFVYETIRILRRELEGRVPLIGFGAAPFTLATYLVEGRGGKGFHQIKRMLYGDSATLYRLLDIVTEMLDRYLKAQVRAGAQALQIFDTWAGLLSPADYREYALRFAKRLVDSILESGVPVTYFALNSAHLLEEIREIRANVIGVDWRMTLAEASRRLEDRFVLQGNLDPCVLLSTPEEIARRAHAVLEDGAVAPGHIMNLGHGILPETPVEHARLLVEVVKARAVEADEP
jgi:uroporphyrinogen decarboxylase